MTKVYSERDGNRYILSARGHSTGSPEVCAGVSAILYALLGFLENCPDKEIFYRETGSGHVTLDCQGGATVRAAFDMANIGLLQIQAKHPDYISVDCVET